MFDFNVTHLLQIVTLLFGGGLLGVILTYRHNMRRLDLEANSSEREVARVDFNTVLAEVKAQRDEAWAYSQKQEVRISQMEAEINGLRLARDLDPFPHWIVDRSGEYMYVNREFERYFLEPQGKTYRDAIGQTHETLGWPSDFCEKLRTLDALAQSRPDGRARAVCALRIAELGMCQVTVHKLPIRFKPSNIIIGYAGYITDVEPETQLLGAQT